MHSLESLREIREMEFFLFGGLSREEFYSHPHPYTPPVKPRGKVVAVARYNFKTREITVTPVSQ